MYQTTLKDSIEISGVGVHTGERVTLTVKPAPVNTGIIFRRMDTTPPINIPALSTYVHDTRLCTTLLKEGVKVSMVEHVLSAMMGLGIDNAFIELTNPEVPILDGSAYPLVALMEKVGYLAQSDFKYFLKIKKTVEVQEGDKWAKIEPYEGFTIAFEMDFDHPAILRSNQYYRIDLSSSKAYIDHISSARTFGFLSEYEYLKAQGLALGGSLENAVVLDEKQIINPGGLRYANELTRHKILDAMGDLYLLGHKVLGAFSAYKSGHTLNYALVRQILSNPSHYEKVRAHN